MKETQTRRQPLRFSKGKVDQYNARKSSKFRASKAVNLGNMEIRRFETELSLHDEVTT